jgi:hypothetical protein
MVAIRNCKKAFFLFMVLALGLTCVSCKNTTKKQGMTTITKQKPIIYKQSSNGPQLQSVDQSLIGIDEIFTLSLFGNGFQYQCEVMLIGINSSNTFFNTLLTEPVDPHDQKKGYRRVNVYIDTSEVDLSEGNYTLQVVNPGNIYSNPLKDVLKLVGVKPIITKVTHEDDNQKTTSLTIHGKNFDPMATVHIRNTKVLPSAVQIPTKNVIKIPFLRMQSLISPKKGETIIKVTNPNGQSGTYPITLETSKQSKSNWWLPIITVFIMVSGFVCIIVMIVVFITTYKKSANKENT